MIGKFAGGAFVLLLTVQLAQAQTCLQPIPPFVPKNPADIREYSDILRRDMEAYFTDVEQYFRCQDIALFWQRFPSWNRLPSRNWRRGPQ